MNKLYYFFRPMKTFLKIFLAIESLFLVLSIILSLPVTRAVIGGTGVNTKAEVLSETWEAFIYFLSAQVFVFPLLSPLILLFLSTAFIARRKHPKLQFISTKKKHFFWLLFSITSLLTISELIYLFQLDSHGAFYVAPFVFLSAIIVIPSNLLGFFILRKLCTEQRI